jgi:hypothetical protein
MKTQDTELLKARRELANFLDQVSPVANGHELNTLLADMNREDALGFQWDKVGRLRARVWYPLRPDAYSTVSLKWSPTFLLVLPTCSCADSSSSAQKRNHH